MVRFVVNLITNKETPNDHFFNSTKTRASYWRFRRGAVDAIVAPLPFVFTRFATYCAFRLVGFGLCRQYLTLPWWPGLIMTTPRKSNFDLTGAKLVTRGALVSWHGIRFTVSRVRLGTVYPQYPLMQGRYFDCNSVQVVA